jgi:hypothetical protein
MEICLKPVPAVLPAPIDQLPTFPGAGVHGLLLDAFVWFDDPQALACWRAQVPATYIRWYGTLLELSQGNSAFAREFRIGFREQQPGLDSDVPIQVEEWPAFCAELKRYGRQCWL